LNRLEYLLAASFLRLLSILFLPFRVRANRVVLATARLPRLEGNLAYVHAALTRLYPDIAPVLLLEPYSYGLRGKLAYLLRLARAMFYLRTARLVVIDNAYLPVHVAAHRAGTTVVQLWHAVGALKRFGLDAPLAEPERTFLHRHYDNVVVSSEATRRPVSTALRTPLERVIALGTARTDFFFDPPAMAAAREGLLQANPLLAGRRVVLYAPTFRGRGRGKRAADAGLDARRLRALLPAEFALTLKTHPNLDADATPRDGYDLVWDPADEINELFTVADVLVTDYSSSIFEWALLRRPLVLLVPDLAEYERDPGLYLDFRRDMIGAQVADTEGVARAILAGDFDMSGYDAFIERHMGACDGQASERFVERFVGGLDSA
jgi:CDP-glycerol glycerophosphotransferase (TagB/SpsB family)